jgi:hypothetical protein
VARGTVGAKQGRPLLNRDCFTLGRIFGDRFLSCTSKRAPNERPSDEGCRNQSDDAETSCKGFLQNNILYSHFFLDVGFYTGPSPPRGQEVKYSEANLRRADEMDGVGTNYFPSGLSSVPFELKFPDSSTRKLELVAGFFGIEQDSEDLALSPVIGWCVAEPPPLIPVLIR